MLNPDLAATLRSCELARVVAEDPVRAFYAHVRHFATDLLCCTTDASQLAADGLASTCSAGIFGPLAAFFGSVEPQLRGSLHIHMLLYIYGFNSPQSLLDRFASCQSLLEQSLAAWVKSILQTSVEYVADTWSLQPDAALAALRPLPYNEWQKDASGDDFREYVALAGTGWRAAAGPAHFVASPGPWCGTDAVVAADEPEQSTFFPYPLQYLAWGPEAPPEEFTRCLLWDYRASLLACQMHACRSGTCSIRLAGTPRLLPTRLLALAGCQFSPSTSLLASASWTRTSVPRVRAAPASGSGNVRDRTSPSLDRSS